MLLAKKQSVTYVQFGHYVRVPFAFLIKHVAFLVVTLIAIR